jgi:hypothetical protein
VLFGNLGVSSLATAILSIVLWVVCVVGMLFYCGFAAIHAVQHLSSPQDRATWMVLIVGWNVLGACWYYCTVYQQFRASGLSGLIPRNVTKNND